MTYSGGIPSGSKNANDPLATGSFSSDPGQDVFPANVFPPATSSSDYSLYSSNGPTIVSNIFAHYNIPKSVDQLPFGFGEGIKTIRNRPSGSTYGSFKNNKERKFQKKPSGFTPADLCTGPNDYWWNPDSLINLVVDGAKVTSFTDSVNSLALTEGTAADQLTLSTAYAWTSEKTGAALIGGPGDGFRDTVIPLALTNGGVDVTFAFVAKLITSANGWLINSQLGMHDAAKRFSIALRHNQVRIAAPGGNATRTGTSFVENQIITPVLVADGGNASLTIPGVLDPSNPLTRTYTPTTASTDPAGVYAGDHAISMAWGECVIISRAITAAEITQLREYWADKYGAP